MQKSENLRKKDPRQTTGKARFDIVSEYEFMNAFLNIISQGSKDNTYKFAMARFLLEYSNDHKPDETHVEYDTIARCFLKYYWMQVCKMKMKHAPQTTKKPVIVRIIEKEFKKNGRYPQTFQEIEKEKDEEINWCRNEIVKKCFHDVTWRFQKVKFNRGIEVGIFYNYKIAKEKNSNKKRVDIDYGINLNSDAMRFFKKYNSVLLKALILEWSRFLEKLNVGMPRIIAKTDGKVIKRGSLEKYRDLLRPLQDRCFYCNCKLEEKETHVEHVIPFDYVAEDNIWNLVLSCKGCNCEKLGALPPKKYIKILIERNIEQLGYKRREFEQSFARLDSDFEKTINRHYENAESHGYMALKRKDFPSKPCGKASQKNM